MHLDDLWQELDNLHQKSFPNHPHHFIPGNGEENKPVIMFIFINPTARNISSDPSWEGPRYPFIGTKQVWRVFYRAGLFDVALMDEIEKGNWSVSFSQRVLRFLQQQKMYLTNLVKWTGHDATLPDGEKILLFLPLLEKEIKLVQPEYIVTFGLLPFEKLLRQKIKLGDYYKQVMEKRKLFFYTYHDCKVIPCYFPVGRGNPGRAVNILSLVKRQVKLYCGVDETD